jgi:hypothetical protein
MHDLLILLYTIAGAISFFIALILVKKRDSILLFRFYLYSLIAMVAALVFLLIWEWPVLEVLTQIVYSALIILGGYTIYRAFTALHKFSYRYTGWRLDFIDDIGFTTISLFDTLVIVGAIEMGLPVWAALIIAVLSVFAGRWWLQYTKQEYIKKRAKQKKRRSSGNSEG